MAGIDNIPAHALERMKGLRGTANPQGIFTSDFSVNEFLLVRKAGFEPIGLCVGSCIYHIGVQFGRWSKNSPRPRWKWQDRRTGIGQYRKAG